MFRLVLLMVSLFMFNSLASAACSPAIEATTPDADFIVHGDGTVTHKKTGLMWKVCIEVKVGGWDNTTQACLGANRYYTWEGAFSKAETQNSNGGYAGHTDWRVPNIKELASIVERKCWGPALNENIFRSTGSYLWSSTPVPTVTSRADKAFAVHFSTSGSDKHLLKTGFERVRLVRTVQ